MGAQVVSQVQNGHLESCHGTSRRQQELMRLRTVVLESTNGTLTIQGQLVSKFRSRYPERNKCTDVTDVESLATGTEWSFTKLSCKVRVTVPSPFQAPKLGQRQS